MIIPDEVNYVEFISGEKVFENDEALVLSTLITEEEFENKMDKARKVCGTKPSRKTFKQFVKGDLFYNVSDDGAISVHSITPVCTLGDRCFGYEKKKLTIVNFPSTTKYDAVVQVCKQTFKVSNRVYINFEKRENDNFIYVNYNHDPNVDWDIVTQDIKRAVDAVS